MPGCLSGTRCARTCRIADVAYSDIYAPFGILVRSSVDSSKPWQHLIWSCKALYWRARRSSEWHHPAHGKSRKESRRTGLLLASGQFLHGDRRASRRRGRSIGSADTGTLAGGVRQAFTQSTPVRFAAMRSMLYCRVPSRALGAGAGSIAVLPQALAGDTGALLVPAEARAAPPAWPAEFSWSVYRYQNYWRLPPYRCTTELYRAGRLLGPARNVLIRAVILVTCSCSDLGTGG